MRKAVLIGDSIRAGYQDTVREQLRGAVEIWEPAENGGNSRNVLAHLDAWAISRSPDVIHINCGLHDLRRQFGQDDPAVPLQEYGENVRAILTRLQSETDATVLWASTTPVNEVWHHNKKRFDRFEADVDAYNAAARGIACELGIQINDLFSVVRKVGRDNLLQPDGVHFIPAGCALLGKHVADAISSCEAIDQRTDSGDKQ